MRPLSVSSCQLERRQATAALYLEVGFAPIDNSMLDDRYRCGQYAPLCGASVGLWPMAGVDLSGNTCFTTRLISFKRFGKQLLVQMAAGVTRLLVLPLQEGNGRTTKEFLSQVAKAAGYELELDRISAKTWNDAAARQMQGDGRRVHEIFEKIAIPSRAAAFRDEHITDALKRFPELQGAAHALDAARVKAETSISPTDRRAFLYQVKATLLERLHAGELINAPAVKPPPHAVQQTHEPYRR